MNRFLVCLTLAVCLSRIPIWGAEPAAADEVAELRNRIARQQAQIDELRALLREQGEAIRAITADWRPALPVANVAPAPAIAAAEIPVRPNEVPPKLWNGFQFSGDFRYRLDLQLRPGNEFAAPLQNTRGRYRLRLNVDKEVARGLTAHAQLSTGPLSNETTNDQDFGALAIKHTFALSEAWMQYRRGGFSVRGGRMEEVFADNSRFLWDDDLRLNGFEVRNRMRLGSAANLEIRAAAYVLTNPNMPLVPAGSPYLAIGYLQGQKVRDAMLFHPGVVLQTKARGWDHQFTAGASLYRNADEIQLASTQAGYAALTSSTAGLALAGPPASGGNALTAPGSALYAARRWQILHGGWRADYREWSLGNRQLPFYADLQFSANTGTGGDRHGWMASASLGEARKLGDVRVLYQFGYKQANSMIAQFSDDDFGTGNTVNIRVNAIRLDFGLTRFLEWQNLLFVQDPIAASRPGFFVATPRGANTTFRYLGQLAFTF